MTIYRQGDVLLVRVSAVPPGIASDPQSTEGGRLILQRGEVTGHHHSVAVADAELLTDGATADAAERYLRVHRETALTHQEHAPILLPPADYRIVIQREYHPESIRRVAD